jgi:hypothetical protein
VDDTSMIEKIHHDDLLSFFAICELVSQKSCLFLLLVTLQRKEGTANTVNRPITVHIMNKLMQLQ